MNDNSSFKKKNVDNKSIIYHLKLFSSLLWVCKNICTTMNVEGGGFFPVLLDYAEQNVWFQNCWCLPVTCSNIFFIMCIIYTRTSWINDLVVHFTGFGSWRNQTRSIYCSITAWHCFKGEHPRSCLLLFLFPIEYLPTNGSQCFIRFYLF